MANSKGALQCDNTKNRTFARLKYFYEKNRFQHWLDFIDELNESGYEIEIFHSLHLVVDIVGLFVRQTSG
ncbi:MAG: hypothetical protein J6Y35_05795 [Bacteroidales bacterium]|nr:hypothetical protein [Bacteroidales bacterium]